MTVAIILMAMFVGFCIWVHVHTADAVTAAKELMRDELCHKTRKTFDNSAENFMNGDVSEEIFTKDEFPELEGE